MFLFKAKTHTKHTHTPQNEPSYLTEMVYQIKKITHLDI